MHVATFRAVLSGFSQPVATLDRLHPVSLALRIKMKDTKYPWTTKPNTHMARVSYLLRIGCKAPMTFCLISLHWARRRWRRWRDCRAEVNEARS